MQHIQQAFAWWSYAGKELSAEQLVRTAVEIGYTGIDLAPPEHWQMIKDHGLTISSYGGHISLTEGLNRREHHAHIEQEILANLKLAVQWGIPNLICFSGNRAGLDDTTGAEVTAEGLRRVAKAAEDAGVTLILELLNSKIDHPDYQCDKSAWGLEVCAMVASPRVKLLYDIYHMQIMEGDIIRTIREYHEQFAHYHTAGNPGRHDIDATQELNYPAIFQSIAETGYSGYICHEFIPTGDAALALKAAFNLCQTAIRR